MRRLVATGKAEDLKLCIDFVAKLKDVNSREKALDGLAIALAGQTVNAPENWAAIEPELRKDPKLVALANKLAVSFRDPAAIKRAVDAATNEVYVDEIRIEAVRQIGQLKPTEGVKVLLDLVSREKIASVRAEAMRALASFNDPKIPVALLASWKGLSKDLQGEAVNTLATRKEWARALLTAMDAKKVDRTAVTDNTILRIQAFNDAEINKLIEKAWGRTRPTPGRRGAKPASCR